jgi:hypothetical protein
MTVRTSRSFSDALVNPSLALYAGEHFLNPQAERRS